MARWLPIQPKKQDNRKSSRGDRAEGEGLDKIWKKGVGNIGGVFIK